MRRAAALVGGAVALMALGAWFLTADDGTTAHGNAQHAAPAVAVLRAPGEPPPESPQLPTSPAPPEGSPLPPAASAPAEKAPEAERIGPGEVGGRVHRVAGDVPLPGAEVALLGAPDTAGVEAVLARGLTPDDGTFRLDAGDVRPAAVRVTWQSQREVLVDGSAYDVRVPRDPVVLRAALPRAGKLPLDMALDVDTGWSVIGRVFDAQGAGVEDAFVAAGEAGPQVRTLADGGFVLQDLERRTTPTDVSAWAAGRRSQVLTLDTPVDDSVGVMQDFVLPRAGLVSGFVVDPDGRSLPGAYVLAVVPGSSGEGTTLQAPSAKSEASGRYELEDLPDGRLDLLCAWMLHVPGTEASTDVRHMSRLRNVRVQTDAPTLADVHLTRGTTLSGRVVADDGMTAPNLRFAVEYWTVSGLDAGALPLFVQARTHPGHDGSFVLTGLDPGPGELQLLEDDWRFSASRVEPLPWSRQVSSTDAGGEWNSWKPIHAVRLDLPPEGLAGVELQPQDRVAPQWQAVNAAGDPVPDARLDFGSGSSGALFALTGADGLFGRGTCDGNVPLGVRVSAEGCIPVTVYVSAASGMEHPLRVELSSAPALHVLVVDHESGEPLPGALLRWHLLGDARQETVVRGPVADDGTALLHADRREGRWVLFVEEPAHRAWRREAAIEATDEPLHLTVRLLRR